MDYALNRRLSRSASIRMSASYSMRFAGSSSHSDARATKGRIASANWSRSLDSCQSSCAPSYGVRVPWSTSFAHSTARAVRASTSLMPKRLSSHRETGVLAGRACSHLSGLSEKHSFRNLSPAGTSFAGPVRRARSGGYPSPYRRTSPVPGHLRGAGGAVSGYANDLASAAATLRPRTMTTPGPRRIRAPAQRCGFAPRSRFRRLRRRNRDHPHSSLSRCAGGHGTREHKRTKDEREHGCEGERTSKERGRLS